MADEEKLEKATEMAKEATRRTHEAVADAKAIRNELKLEIEEVKELLSRLNNLYVALGEVLK